MVFLYGVRMACWLLESAGDIEFLMQGGIDVRVRFRVRFRVRNYWQKKRKVFNRVRFRVRKRA